MIVSLATPLNISVDASGNMLRITFANNLDPDKMLKKTWHFIRPRVFIVC